MFSINKAWAFIECNPEIVPPAVKEVYGAGFPFRVFYELIFVSAKQLLFPMANLAPKKN